MTPPRPWTIHAATPSDTSWRACRRGWAGMGLAAVSLLTGCTGLDTPKLHAPQEKFSSVETYSRLYDAPPAQTCEAARRALLSQGYLVTQQDMPTIEGKKRFQPEPESHLEIMIRVVCVPDNAKETISLAFATAIQDSYTLKKSNSSASVGLGALGSVSMPITATNDGMTKVGSMTIASPVFYERFFDLVRQYLLTDVPQTE